MVCQSVHTVTHNGWINTTLDKTKIYQKPWSERHAWGITHLKAKTENLLERITADCGIAVVCIAMAQFGEAEQYILKLF